MPFEGLRERLLKGGIAPRHVRRYLRELEEHLADLTQAQRDAGLNQADAARMARAQLGEDENLAKAMLEQRDFRSISARFPWAVFVIVPPMAVLAGIAIFVLLMVGLAKAHGVLVNQDAPAPAWFWDMGAALFAVVNFTIMPLVAAMLTFMAWRQRLPAWWLVCTIAVLLPLVVDAHIISPGSGDPRGALSVGTGLAFGIEKLQREVLAGSYGGLVRDVLILLPLAILLLMRRRVLAKVPLSS
jgi:hypothetical protein